MNLENLVNSLSPNDFKSDPFGRTDKNKVALQVLKDPGIAIRKLWSLGIPFNISIAIPEPELMRVCRSQLATLAEVAWP